MSSNNDQKRKKLLIWKFYVTMTKKDAYMKKILQILNHFLTFIHKIKKILSATSILSYSPIMAFNITASLDNLTCTVFVDFEKCQDRFGQLSWSKKDSNSLDVKLQCFQERGQQRVPTCTKTFNGRSRLQPLHAIEKSAGHSSRNLC